MDVRDAMMARRSVRGFLETPVETATLERLATAAARTASGGNLQPWHVDLVTGEALTRLKAIMLAKLASGEDETHEYEIYPKALTKIYRDRRFAVGEALYERLGIPRGGKAERRQWFAQNFAFFGAPAAIFITIDKTMGPPQWQDIGWYLASFALLAVEEGLATCPQECWAMYPQTVRAFLGTPDHRLLFCGMAVGYEDKAHPANALRTDRADPGEWLRVIA